MRAGWMCGLRPNAMFLSFGRSDTMNLHGAMQGTVVRRATVQQRVDWHSL